MPVECFDARQDLAIVAAIDQDLRASREREGGETKRKTECALDTHGENTKQSTTAGKMVARTTTE